MPSGGESFSGSRRSHEMGKGILVLWTRKVLWSLEGRASVDSAFFTIAERSLNLGEGLRSFVRRQSGTYCRAMPYGSALNLPFMASEAISIALCRPVPAAFYSYRARKMPVK